jgi:hypothetical protein
MAAKVEDRDPVPVSEVLEDVQDLGDCGVGALDDLAEAGLLRREHGLAHPAELVGEVPQIADLVDAIVREREQHNRPR